MSEQELVLPDGWSRAPGWSYGVVMPQGSQAIVVAGQFGWDPETQKCVSGSFAEQWEQALRNVLAVVESAGGSASTISSLRMYVTDLDAYHAAGRELGKSWIEVLGKHFPAMTLLHVSGLTDPDAMLEVEAVAYRPAAA
jgi:enamine deaminase RidA (YjgF/YER057c/UK114 family)